MSEKSIKADGHWLLNHFKPKYLFFISTTEENSDYLHFSKILHEKKILALNLLVKKSLLVIHLRNSNWNRIMGSYKDVGNIKADST